MSNEPLIAFEELLAPIPGDDPAGESVPFGVRAELEEARKEIDLADFGPNDPLRPTEAKKADWKGIVRTTTKALTTQSKDLLVAARLTEALVKLHGYAGLADGLTLLRRLMDECWDRIQPTIEDGDLDVRAGPFNWIGDDGRGARFPHTLRTVPLYSFDGEAVSLRDWRLIQEGKNKGKVSRETYDKAIAAATREHCQKLVEDLDRSAVEVTELNRVLSARLGASAPGLNDIRTALSEALILTREVLQRKGGAAVPASELPATGDGTGPTADGPQNAMATREDVYKRLTEAANQLEKMEPHSPVPYIVRRAVALGSLPFPELMKVLVREEYRQALTEMNRELGIKEDAVG